MEGTPPTPLQYQTSIQNPQDSFRDADLRQSQVACTAVGLPQIITGTFSCVFRVGIAHRAWAVKCFTKHAPDRGERYAVLSDFFRERGEAIEVSFEYLSEGILVDGTWYPVVKMDWIEGLDLNRYVEGCLLSANMASLLRVWPQLVRRLRAAGVAHGDLQHGNILIQDRNIRLVDYDGMFVPTLTGWPSSELGHRNYQHPSRDASHFDAGLDNFSALAIYVALIALTQKPSLWLRHNDGENLIFKAADFVNPRSSELFSELMRSSDSTLRRMAFALRESCEMPPADVPELGSVIDGSVQVSRVLSQWRTRSEGEEARLFINDSLAFDRGVLLMLMIVAVSAIIAALTRSVTVGLPLALLSLLLVVSLILRYEHLVVDGPGGKLELLEKIAEAETNTASVQEGINQLSNQKSKSVQAIRSAEQGRASVEAQEQRRIAEEIGKATAAIEAARRAHTQSYTEEETQLSARRESFRAKSRMRERAKYDIAAAVIPGIGQGLKLRLAQAAIRSAADISPSNLDAVRGFGEARVASLMAWQKLIDGKIAPRLPTRLPEAAESAIRAKFATRRERIKEEESSLSKGLTQLEDELELLKALLGNGTGEVTSSSPFGQRRRAMEQREDNMKRALADLEDSLERQLTELGKVERIRKGLVSDLATMNFWEYVKHVVRR